MESELAAERAELVTGIQGIEAQLSARDKTDLLTGERLSDHAYHEWRRRAVFARTQKLERLREVNALLRDARKASADVGDSRLDRIEAKVEEVLLRLPDVGTADPIRLLLDGLGVADLAELKRLVETARAS